MNFSFGRASGKTLSSSNVGIADAIKLISSPDRFKTAAPLPSEVSLDSLESNVKEYYVQNILPLRQDLEEVRYEKIDIMSKRLFYSAVAMALTLPLSIWLTLHFKHEAWLMMIMVLGGGIAYWGFQPARDYNLLIKNKVFSRLVTIFSPDARYIPEGNYLLQKIKPYDILPYYENDHCEDNIRLKHEDVELELEEFKLTKEQGSGKNRRTVTVFRGLAILAQMNKNFSGKTLVKKDAGKVGNWFGEKFSSLEKITLEDVGFEKEFEVYSTDQIEARYLLTTSFMERLQSLRNHFGDVAGIGTGDFQCSFFENKLLLLIPTEKNMFEPHPLTKPAIQITEISNFIREIQHIFAVVEQLKLNMKIGM